VNQFASSLKDLREGIRYCKKCHNISDLEICQICSNPHRDASTLCVVEDIRDVMAIENTQQYKGLYHVLGGVISPMDGIGPQHLTIDSLMNKVQSGEVNEIIFALSTTMEGDTTNFYIFKRLKNYPVKVSTIARGIAFGDELEYADEITLGRSIANRLPYESSINS
jgi:recombination protein RecR